MRSFEDLIPEGGENLSQDQQEERCEKAIKAIFKAMLMRLFVTGILIWAMVRTRMELWVLGLMLLVLLINLSGLLPLYAEWKKQRKLLNDLIESEEA